MVQQVRAAEQSQHGAPPGAAARIAAPRPLAGAEEQRCAASHRRLVSLPELTHDLEMKELEARQQGESSKCARGRRSAPRGVGAQRADADSGLKDRWGSVLG